MSALPLGPRHRPAIIEKNNSENGLAIGKTGLYRPTAPPTLKLKTQKKRPLSRDFFGWGGEAAPNTYSKRNATIGSRRAARWAG